MLASCVKCLQLYPNDKYVTQARKKIFMLDSAACPIPNVPKKINLGRNIDDSRKIIDQKCEGDKEKQHFRNGVSADDMSASLTITPPPTSHTLMVFPRRIVVVGQPAVLDIPLFPQRYKHVWPTLSYALARVDRICIAHCPITGLIQPVEHHTAFAEKVAFVDDHLPGSTKTPGKVVVYIAPVAVRAELLRARRNISHVKAGSTHSGARVHGQDSSWMRKWNEAIAVIFS